MTRDRVGLLAALGAVALWSASAITTRSAVAQAPPLLVVAVSFTVASLAGLITATLRGRVRRVYRAPLRVWLMGVGGMCGNYIAFTVAFTLAPAMQVNLLNYLWPVLTLLLAVPLTGSRLTSRVVFAALVAFAGAVLVVTQGHAIQFEPRHLLGCALALYAAVTWAVFSCLIRRYGPEFAGRMPLLCAITAAVTWPVALATGQGAALAGLHEWWPVAVALGLGPLYFAFEFWDAALQRTDAGRVGLLSYLIPALSTLLLGLAGEPLTAASGAGLFLILMGAGIGTLQPSRSPRDVAHAA